MRWIGPLKQLDELFGGQICIAKNGAQQGFLDRLTWMNRHHGSRLRGGLVQNQVAPSLPIFDEAGSL
jgi:hypothetical protein